MLSVLFRSACLTSLSINSRTSSSRTLILLLFLAFFPLTRAIHCYSCANDFIVWQWRHFFLKRNYGMTTSDPACAHRGYRPDTFQSCHSSCFIFYLNGTNKHTGITTVLGVGRGCSSQFLTDDQHLHLGLGSHSKPSDVGDYLSTDFDMYEIHEHWCFCASEYCNTESCYSSPTTFGSSRGDYSFISKRQGSSSPYWQFYSSSSPSLHLSIPVVSLLLWRIL